MPAITYEIGGKNTKLRQSLQDSKQAVRDFRQNLKQQTAGMHADAQAAGGGKGIFGAVLGGNLAAAAIGKMVGAARDGVNAVGELQDNAEQFGISANTIDKMTLAMEGNGVKAEDLRKGLMRLNDARSAALAGDQKAQTQFANLGIGMKDLEKSSLDELFFKAADGLKDIGDSGKAASAALDLIGAKQGRLASVMRQGGESIKKDMDTAWGAMTADAAKNIDDLWDGATNKLNQLKGVAGNVAGAIIGVGKHVAGEYQKGMEAREADKKAGGVEKAIGPISKEVESEKQKAARKEFEAKDHIRLQALAAVVAGKEDVALTKEKEDITQRINAAQKDIADSMRSQWTFSEKFNDARSELVEKETAYQSSLKKNDALQQERALAERDEAKAKFMELKKTAIERAAMPISEQNRLQEQEKQQARDRKHAERTLNAKERDKIDRQFRRGEISEKGRDQLIAAMGALKDEKGPDVLNDQYVKLVSIDGKLKKLIEKVEKI
jgi:hypothetical protein